MSDILIRRARGVPEHDPQRRWTNYGPGPTEDHQRLYEAKGFALLLRDHGYVPHEFDLMMGERKIAFDEAGEPRFI
jgi:hypothetical protein